MNATLAIPSLVDWMKGSPDRDGPIFKAIMKYYKTEALGKSMALRLLIHYFGDIHQPLHCTSRVDDDFPAGDRGGNSFALPYHYTADNLHAVWDAAVYELHKSIKLVNFIQIIKS